MDEDTLRASFPAGSLTETPTLDRLTATFDDESLERGFTRENFENVVRKYVRFSIPVATIAFLSYGIHDYFVVPEIRNLAWLIRYAFFGPLSALVLVLLWKNKKPARHQWLMLAFGALVNIAVLFIGAFANPAGFFIYTGYAIIFLVLGPFLARLNVRMQAAYMAFTTFAFLAIDVGIGHHDLEHRLSFVMSFLTLGVIGILSARQLEMQARIAFMQRRLIRDQMSALEIERGRSEALLLNVLPRKIAQRLKNEPEKTIADRYESVSVLFSDIVGFTEMSARLDAETIVKRLDEVFSKFDEIAEALGLEKIKTIGDAYMVAGGIPSAKKDHVEACCEMALRMRDELAKWSETSAEPVRIRIGIHSGPVVAGVIGKKKFIYDVWGDTVNAASRMESHGAPGQIQVSEATYEATKELFDYEARGTITVKGKGEMKTFFLVARKDVVEGDRVASLPVGRSSPELTSPEE